MSQIAIAKRFVTKNGLDNNNKTSVNLADPVSPTDGSTKQYTDSAVATETTRAEAAEAALVSSVSAEATARSTAISTVSSTVATNLDALHSEVTRAEAAETILTTAVAAAQTTANAANTSIAGLATVAQSGSYVDLNHKPTAVSTWSNDAGYQNASQVNTAIQAVIGAAPTALATLAAIDAQLLADETAAAALTNTVSTKASQSDLSAEIVRAEAAESVLQSNLDSATTAITNEVSNRTTAVSAVVSNLTAEVLRAETAEALLVSKSTTVNGHALSGNVVVTATNVGLGNADNTSDDNKPVSIAQAAADNAILAAAQTYTDAETTRAEAAESTLTTNLSTTTSVANAAVPKTTTVNGHALSGNVSVTAGDVGLGNVNNTSDVNKPVSTATTTAIGVETSRAQAAEALLALKTTTVNGHALSANVVVTASDVGLGNLDNTSDANKPVSTAQAAADAAALASAKSYTDSVVTGMWVDCGSFNASVNTYPTTGGTGSAGAIVKGDIWTIGTVATSGPLNGFVVGTTVRAVANNPGQTVANWAVAEVGLGYTPYNATNPAGYISGNQNVTVSGDASGSGATAISLTVSKINGTSLAGLSTGILKNTTGTGVPSIAVPADFPTLNQNTSGKAATAGNADTVTTNANLTGDVVSTGNVTTVNKLNGVTLSGLSTGLLKNTTGTGAPSIASQTDVTNLLGAGSISNTMLANSAVANLSGTNTGDETITTIKAKLGITTLSGANTGDQTISISGDVTAAGSAGILSATVTKLNGVTLSGLTTGLLKNTTTTGAPSIAVAGTDYLAPGGPLGTPSSGVATNLTGTAAGLTAGNVTTNANLTGMVTSVGNAATVVTNANLTGDVTSVGNATTLQNAPVIAKVLTGYTSGAGTVSASDSILSAIGKLNGNTAALSAAVTGALVYQGTWNATTNVPALTSGAGTKGWYYKVATAGVTSIDGNSQWNIGDMIVFNGTVWDKIDGISTEVTSVAGRVGAVTIAQADVAGLTSGSSPTFNAVTANSFNGTATLATNVTTNANLTGDVTSVGNATTLQNAPVIAKVLTGFVSGAGTISAADSILSAVQKLNGNISNAVAGGVTSIAVASANGLAGTSTGGTTPTVTLTTSVSGLVKGNGTALSAAAQGDVTALLGAGSISNTMLANSAVANLSNTNTGDESATSIRTKLGITTLSGSNTGDQTTITGNAGTASNLQTARTIATGGDATGTATSFDGGSNITIPVTVTKINNTALSGLATGILKNTTATGVPSIAVAGTDFVAPGGALGTPSSGVATNLTGTAAGLTAGTVTTNANLTGGVTSVGNATTVVTNANLTGMVTSVGNATTVVTNANLTGEVTSVGNAATLTNSAVIGKVLSGYASGAGVVSSADTLLSAIQKLNGNTAALSAAVTGALVYQGTWNATTNIPALVSSTGVKGNYYKVSVAGTTSIDSLAQWNVGDMIVFNGTVWDKIDGISTEVTSVAGRVGAVTIAQADVAGLTTGSSPTFAAVNATTFNGALNGNANTVTTNANLTGVVTSTGNTTAIAAGAISNAMLANGAVANLSGTNTGDETLATIKTKLGVTTLSGSNTGDQTITLTGGVTGTGVGSFAATVVTNANLTGPVTSVGNATAIAAGAITNTMLANGAVANLSGINTGDNAVNSNYSADYRAANFVAGTNYQAPLGSGSITNAMVNAITTLPSNVSAPSILGSVNNAVAAAGVAQIGATVLSSDNNVITSGTGGVVVPNAVGGKVMMITNRTGSAVNVYPATGHSFDGLAANAAISLPANAFIEIFGNSTTSWNTSYQALTQGSYVTLTGYASTTGTITTADTVVSAISKLNGNISASGGIGSVLTGYVSGAGTVAATDSILQAIQKLNGNQLAAYGTTFNNQVGTIYTTVLTDAAYSGNAGPMITFTNASAQTVTIPPNSSVAYPVGATMQVVQLGAGKVTFAAGVGVTINSAGSLKSIGAQYAAVTLIQTAANVWLLVGALIA